MVSITTTGPCEQSQSNTRKRSKDLSRPVQTEHIEIRNHLGRGKTREGGNVQLLLKRKGKS